MKAILTALGRIYYNIATLLIPLSKVGRIEVIDGNGRTYVNQKQDNKVRLSFQDNGKTLKVFITEGRAKETRAKAEFNNGTKAFLSPKQVTKVEGGECLR